MPFSLGTVIVHFNGVNGVPPSLEFDKTIKFKHCGETSKHIKGGLNTNHIMMKDLMGGIHYFCRKCGSEEVLTRSDLISRPFLKLR